jgi:hypothetical protein
MARSGDHFDSKGRTVRRSLFGRSWRPEVAGPRAATIIMSLIATAKGNGIEPHAWEAGYLLVCHIMRSLP